MAGFFCFNAANRCLQRHCNAFQAYIDFFISKKERSSDEQIKHNDKIQHIRQIYIINIQIRPPGKKKQINNMWF